MHRDISRYFQGQHNGVRVPSGGQQQVKIKNLVGNSRDIQILVLQETVLGSILSISYVKSLLKFSDGTINCCAYDTLLIFRNKNWNQVKLEQKMSLSK